MDQRTLCQLESGLELREIRKQAKRMDANRRRGEKRKEARRRLTAAEVFEALEAEDIVPIEQLPPADGPALRDPTPAEIAARCAEVQAGWSRVEWLQRAGYVCDERAKIGAIREFAGLLNMLRRGA